MVHETLVFSPFSGKEKQQVAMAMYVHLSIYLSIYMSIYIYINVGMYVFMYFMYVMHVNTVRMFVRLFVCNVM